MKPLAKVPHDGVSNMWTVQSFRLPENKCLQEVLMKLKMGSINIKSIEEDSQ